MPVLVPVPISHLQLHHTSLSSHLGLSTLSSSSSSSVSRLSLPGASSSTTSGSSQAPIASSSKLSLTFSAHHSIPDSVYRVAHHPFNPHYKSSKGTASASTSSSSLIPSTKSAKSSKSLSFHYTRPAEEVDDDEWFFRATGGGYYNHQATSPSTSLDTGSLLLFKERQRRALWIKQVRQREQARALKEQELEEEREQKAAEDRERERKKRKLGLDEEFEKEAKKRKMGDVEMNLDSETLTPREGGGSTGSSNTYSRTLYLRSPSPSSSLEGDRRKKGGSGATSFWGIGGVGLSRSRADTPVPHSFTSSSDEVARGIKVESSDEAPLSRNDPVATPAIQVNGVTVVKTTGAISGGVGGRPRGLWRARGSGPAPTVGNTDGKVQIGGFVFGSGFLAGSSGYTQRYTPTPTTVPVVVTDIKRVGGVKRSRSVNSSSSGSESDSSCSSTEEIRRGVEQEYLSSDSPGPSRPARTSSGASSSPARVDTTAPAKSFNYLGSRGILGSTPPPHQASLRTRSTTPIPAPAVEDDDLEEPALTTDDDDDDLQQKRKQGLHNSDDSQRKRQRKSDSSTSSVASGAAPTRGRSPTRTRYRPAMASRTVHAVPSERKKLLDTSSLAWSDPSVMESRRAAAAAATVTTNSMPPSPSPQWSGYAHERVKEPEVTYEDWEDLKEVWTKCLEVIDVEEPAEMLPLLRGVIHECSRFLQEYDDPSVIFLKPKRNASPSGSTTSSIGVGIGVGTSDGDVEMPSPASTPPPVPPPTNMALKNPTGRRYHHPLCQLHEHNRNRTGTADLPTAFHSLLGTALFFFGNLIGENPELALEGEPRTSTVYHLYALDVFEVGENIPAKTLVGAGVENPNTTATTATSSFGTGLYQSPTITNTVPYAYNYSNSNDVALGAGGDCCALGMKEDWHMAVTWGRTLVCLADNLLERQRVVEERQRQRSGVSFENPAAFLLEDFKVLGLSKGGYFDGTGGMGLSFNGIGQLVPSGSGDGLSAFHSPSAAFSTGPRRSRSDDYWGHRSEPFGSPPASYSLLAMGPVSPSGAIGASTPMNSRHAASEMYPSSSFLSPSFIAASTRGSTSAATSTYASSSTQRSSSSSSYSATYSSATTPILTPGGHDYRHPYDTTNDHDPRRFWQITSPFVVIRSRMPPVTRRMNLGVGGGVNVDEMMTLAMDQFSRGIFHMPRSGVVGTRAGGDYYHHGHGRHGHGHHRGEGGSRSGSVHRHHSHRRNRDRDASTTIAGSSSISTPPPFFSRASHLNTIATQVLYLAEKLDLPESRYKWGKYADSVFEQMRLEENPGAAVVTLVSDSFAGTLNGDEGVMDVDVEGEGTHRHRHGHHHGHHHHGHHHGHGHGRHHGSIGPSSSSSVTSSTGDMMVRPPTSHPDFFLHNNTNPEILKARGRCSLVIGAAKAEEELEGLLEDAYSRADDDRAASSGGSDDDDAALDERVKQVLESEDAEEVRERLEEAVKHLERAREVWRREVWGPRKRAREGVRRKKAKDAQVQREMEMEVVAQRERERLSETEEGEVRRRDPATAKGKERPRKIRRGIGRIAADNKRVPKTLSSPGPSSKGKDRGSTVIPLPKPLHFGVGLESASTTPALEKEAEAAMMASPGTELPPHSPSASDFEVGSNGSGSDSSKKTIKSPRNVGAPSASAAGTAAIITTGLGYFPPRSNFERKGEHDEEDEEELGFRAEEDEEEMEEKDLAQLLAQALYMLGDLAFGKEEKKEMYRRAKEETDRAGKAELLERVLGEEGGMMVVD